MCITPQCLLLLELYLWGSMRKKIVIRKKIKDQIDKSFRDQVIILDLLLKDEILKNKIAQLVLSIRSTFKKSGKVLIAGNGGSFADSQHIAAEFVAKFCKNRIPLPAIALGTNSSNLTAIANDFGYENVFSRELEALSSPNDTLVAISTSGNSKNIINMIKKAEALSINYFVLTGNDGGKLSYLNENLINIPSSSTAVIQQIHILIGHVVVSLSEEDFI